MKRNQTLISFTATTVGPSAAHKNVPNTCQMFPTAIIKLSSHLNLGTEQPPLY